MQRSSTSLAKRLGLLATVALATGCLTDANFEGTPEFPREPHLLLPQAPSPFATVDENGAEITPWQFASGTPTGVGPEQPIEFPHYRHVTELNMQCEYCHAGARKSIHSGVPSTKVCAGCHWQVKADNPEIAKILSFGEGCDFGMDPVHFASGTLNENCEPIEWKKAHDLPDYVHFSHKRHVQGGVNCTECHGQIGLQGQKTTIREKDESGQTVERMGIENVMVRETTLQMGWCLDCHAAHPSIDKNYGDKADLRRAELKDCWTCHK